MFYGELISRLRSDIELSNLVSDYDAAPAIFSDRAPEDANMPYAIVQIDGDRGADSVVLSFTINIDYYDFNTSAVGAEKFCRYLQRNMDCQVITADAVSQVRMFLSSFGFVPTSDAKVIHMNSTYSARAARKLWMSEKQ